MALRFQRAGVPPPATLPRESAGRCGGRAWRAIGSAARAALSALQQWVRGATGAHAYDLHVRHAEKQGKRPLTEQQFYMESIGRKYSRPNRCC